MKLYKYKDLLALLATVGWISFIYAAFRGFHFWYLGFVFFFWLALGILNYRHETTVWLLKNRFSRFATYFTVLAILGFIADYVIGQVLAGFWVYPFYTSLWDWVRLYLLIYPLGGMCVLELIYLLAAMSKERVVLIHKDINGFPIHKILILNEIFLLITVGLCLAFRSVLATPYISTIIVILFSSWVILTTFKLKYYIKHWTHWIGIIGATAILSIFLHEIPNTAVYEWRYYNPPLFPDYSIFGIQLWLVWGWYLLVLVMLKYWIDIVLLRHRK